MIGFLSRDEMNVDLLGSVCTSVTREDGSSLGINVVYVNQG
jgi:hypothetical protein